MRVSLMVILICAARFVSGVYARRYVLRNQGENVLFLKSGQLILLAGSEYVHVEGFARLIVKNGQ